MVSRLKKKAKRLQRETGRPHHEILEQLAQEIGLPNWHHLTLADQVTQRLEAKIRGGLILLYDAKEADDEAGEGFEPFDELLVLRAGELINWIRNVHEHNRQSPELELLDFLHENYTPLIYTGNDRLPRSDAVWDWIAERNFWKPDLVFLKDVMLDADDGHNAGADDDDGVEEAMPVIDEQLLRQAFGSARRGTLVLGSPDTMERYAGIEGPRKAWNWCLHCERAYPQGSYRQVRELQMCPYAGCEGDAFMDLWTWASVRHKNLNYPEVPELGRRYPLYGPQSTG